MRARYARVHMSVARLQSDLDSFTDLIGSRLPCSEANARHAIAAVESIDGSRVNVSKRRPLCFESGMTDLVPLPETEGVTILAYEWNVDVENED